MATTYGLTIAGKSASDHRIYQLLRAMAKRQVISMNIQHMKVPTKSRHVLISMLKTAMYQLLVTSLQE